MPFALLARALSLSQALVERYTNDLTAPELIQPPFAGGNPPVYILGHLCRGERAAHGYLELLAPSGVDDGFLTQFGRGKVPPTDLAAYGDPRRMLPLFNRLRDTTLAALPDLTSGHLAKPLAPPTALPIFTNLGEALNYVALHTMAHAGQLAATRRALGKPSVL